MWSEFISSRRETSLFVSGFYPLLHPGVCTLQHAALLTRRVLCFVRQVIKLLQYTRSADYDPETLPSGLKSEMDAAFKRMASAFRERVRRKVSNDRNPEQFQRWGFKAPVSMYCVPMWARVFPGASFVHVVRDGRDMAFHWLQSPVKRYWPPLFPDSFHQLKDRSASALIPDHGSYVGKAYIYDVSVLHSKTNRLNTAPHFRIAELWSKSNLEVERAGRRLVSRVNALSMPGEAGADTGTPHLQSYVMVRSEDFVTTESKFLAASRALVDAVQPHLSFEEACCLGLSHWDMEHKSSGWSKNIQNYGKWKGAIQKYGGKDGPLYAGILSRSVSALERFGYLEGGTDWTYETSVDGTSCSALSACPNIKPHQQKCLD